MQFVAVALDLDFHVGSFVGRLGKQAVTRSKVAVVGGINSPESAEEIIATGKADFVVLARQAFADPEFPNKAADGREDLIRRCVRCFHCYPGGYREHETELPLPEFVPFVLPQMLRQVGQCAINRTSNFHIHPEEILVPAAARRVLVVGGGVAGMQAAITASERGHTVTLAERSSVLGGTLNFTDHDVHKTDLRHFKNVLIREIETRGIEVRLNTEVNPEFLRKFRPEAVIIAVGSTPVIPPISGIENAVDALELYRNLDKVGSKVIMIGGGLVGCETGLNLAAMGREVTVLEMLDRMAPESFSMPLVVVNFLARAGVTAKSSQKCHDKSPAKRGFSDKPCWTRTIDHRIKLYLPLSRERFGCETLRRELDLQPLAHRARGSLERLKSNRGIRRIKQTPDGRAARLHPARKLRRGDVRALHLAGDLEGDHALGRDGFGVIEDVLLAQEVIKVTTYANLSHPSHLSWRSAMRSAAAPSCRPSR